MLARAACAGLVAVAIAPADARTEDFCGQLKTLTAAASADFSGHAATDPSFAGVESCSLSQSSGGITRLTCRWAFDYRAEAARAKVAAVEAEILSCLPGLAATDEIGVNHPDTFEQRHFEDETVAIALSLKDKAALGASYVFIGIERAR